jgi:hypothetical protein
MAKPKPQALSYSMRLIELEKLNVLKRTDERIASIQREAQARTKTNFTFTLAVCVLLLLVYTAMTFSTKCHCTCNI